MPVESMKDFFRIKDIALSGGTAHNLTFQCKRGDVFVVCISENGVRRDELKLSRDQLDKLYDQKPISLESPKCELCGFSKRVYTERGNLEVKNIHPMSFVQVWAMSADNFGNVRLYVPDNPSDQSVRCRLQIALKKSPNPAGAILRVEVDRQYVGYYQDGDLMYSVSEHPSIPITRDWLNRDIPLTASSSEVKFLNRTNADQWFDFVWLT